MTRPARSRGTLPLRRALAMIFGALAFIPIAQAADRPNVLWITSEDNGPEMGCYGDENATTPNLDELAKKGTVYRYCWSNAPVCAPARTTLISGMYPASLGAQHMRSLVEMPEGFKMYPQYLREAGYYCTNNNKEDYNLVKPGEVWSASSRQAHWRNRKEGQPFFAIFNFTVSHESQIRKRPHEAEHDPAKVRVPAYHPDTKESRQDWAQYYDKVTEMDAQAGKVLEELAADGLTDDTIIFYYGDHGSGMPRSKRWPYNSGLHVPLIVHIPEKFQHLATDDYEAGGTSNRLVSFVDLPPTLLSLCGVKPPQHFQGHAFLGEFAEEPQPYIYGFRGRMDERFDMVRTVRNERFIYIRNYMPHKIYGQFIEYMFQTPTTRVWHEMYTAGELTAPQTFFWEEKPVEELYDLQADPDEVSNLADSPEHQEILQELRKAQQEWVLQIRDLGFLPEAEIHSRSAAFGLTPYEYGHSDGYDLEKIWQAAELAAQRTSDNVPLLIDRLADEDSAVRYWAVLGLMIRGEEAVQTASSDLSRLLQDKELSPRVTAAHALALYSDDTATIEHAIEVLLKAANIETEGVYSAMMAMNALDEIDDRAMSVKARIEELPRKSDQVPGRMSDYVDNLISKTLMDLK